MHAISCSNEIVNLFLALIAFLAGTVVDVNFLGLAAKDDGDDGPPVWMVYVTDVNASAFPETWEVNVANWPVDGDGEQNVTVTNFPLDEQGNLRVSSQTSSKVITAWLDLTMEHDACMHKCFSFILCLEDPMQSTR